MNGAQTWPVTLIGAAEESGGGAAAARSGRMTARNGMRSDEPLVPVGKRGLVHFLGPLRCLRCRRRRRPDGLEASERQIDVMVKVEGEEPLPGRLLELGERHAAAEVRVGGDDRLGEIEKPEAPGALVLVLHAAEEARAAAMAAPAVAFATAATPAAAAAAAFAAGFSRCPRVHHHPEARAAL